MNKVVALMMIALSVLTGFASGLGLMDPNLYQELVSPGTITPSLVYGSIVQDVISLPASILLLMFSMVYLKKGDSKWLILMLGLTSYFFYGYGLYTIQGQYTSIYLIYLTIWGISIYCLIFGLIVVFRDVKEILIPKKLRIAIATFYIMILLVLIPAWIGRMSSDLANRIPGELYGVFVLDLAVVFPALAIIAYLLLKGRSSGSLLTGVAMVKVFTLCLSVALGEWLKPAYGFPQDFSMILIFSLLTLISALLGLIYLRKLKLHD